jgi:hypothetical protein
MNKIAEFGEAGHSSVMHRQRRTMLTIVVPHNAINGRNLLAQESRNEG